ncbi:fimbrial biogenesis chaperone [Marinimicrococcus flavescens]|uniref:Fimbria/pilus periplasmic chaperone n=1 Tax=Marinimicrococcus flavescens TaxID=3031815 RepID=A0AAP4D5U2_9PROT|nr:fimbria/pilus periplasmic chaperone [Marinimicrococcus flavescens]
MRALLPLILAAALGAPAAMAGSLGVSPVRVELAPGQRAASVTLRNDGAEPVMVQVEPRAWVGSAQLEALEPTRGLVAVPPMLTVEPGERRVVRVARRAAEPPAREESFRLLLTEVPLAGEGALGVRFALRLSIPVFVQPQAAAAEPAWRLERAGEDLVLRLANRGNAHLRIERLLLHDAGGAELVAVPGPAYVLAGREESWRLDGLARLHPRLALRGETSLGPIDLELPAQGG